MNKDWTGNSNSIYKTLGASNHTDKHRQQQDYYATEPKAVELLLEVEQFNKSVWEPACGEGHIAEVFVKHGYNVRASDLIDRGYGEQQDFLFFNDEHWEGDIVTNPPYARAVDFVNKALDIIPDGNKVAMFLKIQFLEGKERKGLYKNHPPKIIYVSSSRLLCAKNAEFEKMIEGGGSAVAYAWFIWQKGYKGETVIKWIN
ncbi:MAG: NAD(P)-dependent oxidoreductase [Candidatus Omnitrophica bacterium]|jgi:hypothetical protein|nr:NAD(P)-dependent oxidoreductase [Candidatus Omnitrophota bacterium]MDD5353382.1 NAD(P)-dependent oxidoreductase [Candidatus Omnitrophota bacterium]MDD5551436.1 NAD(P)-dependent oxidoreductase [Candidatus Omnitrophota bacterium]